MRLGLAVVANGAVVPKGAEVAAAVDEAGLDLLWWTAGRDHLMASPLLAAAEAPAAESISVVVDIALRGLHPLALAEERNVTDQLLGGRLVVALDGDPDETVEVADVLVQAASARPFTHVGPRWKIPAGLPVNSINPERAVRVTPQPAALTPQVWLHATTPNDRSGLPVVDSATTWAELDRGARTLARHAVRPAVRYWRPRDESPGQLAARLRGEGYRHGLDFVAIHMPAHPLSDEWHAGIRALAQLIRPRLQMDSLPNGLEEHWDQTLPTRDPRQMTVKENR